MKSASRMPARSMLIATLTLVTAACAAPEIAATTTQPDASTTAESSTTVAVTEPVPTTTGSTTPPTTESTESFATVEGANGSVDIPNAPAAIVSLSPTATEMLFAIGAGNQVVAVDEYSYFPDEAPVTDLSGFTPNLEAIADFEPDLVVVSDDIDGIVEAIDGVGIPILHLPAAASFDDVYSQIRTLGEATGNATRADAVASDLEADIEAAIADAGGLGAGLTVYHELDNTFYSVTSQTFVGLVYEAFGLENIADNADPDGFGYPQLSAEYIIESNPDLIFITDCCGDTVASVGERPGWDSISAVRNGAVTVVDADVASRWGPRLVEFFESVSATIVGLNG